MIMPATLSRWTEGDREYAEAYQEALSEQSQLLGKAMSYADFSLEEVKERFNLEIEQRTRVFSPIASQQISPLLRDTLEESMYLALATSSEKARAEFIVAPVMMEIRRRLESKISIHSGRLFKVDEDQGLNGFADFLLSLSPDQLEIEAPAVVVVESKKDNLNEGIPQCLAEMVAAQIFNRRAGKDIKTIYGAVTRGDVWQFMSLTGTNATIDLTLYYINEVERIVGILVHMLKTAAGNAQRTP